MANHRYTADEIVAKLEFAQRLEDEGATTAEVCRRLEVSELTYLRWYKKCSGLGASAVARLWDLEDENVRLASALERVERLLVEVRGVRNGSPAGRTHLSAVVPGLRSRTPADASASQ